MKSTHAKLTCFLLVGFLTMSSASLAVWADASTGAGGCQPSVEVISLDGDNPAAFTAPVGFLNSDALNITVAASHVGETCAGALNSPPQLLSPWVTPLWGPPTEWVTYHVTYVDTEGDAPTYIHVIIDNTTTIELSPAPGSVLDYAAGVEFEGSPQSPLRMGWHAYRFHAADLHDEATTEMGYGPRIIDFVTGAVDQANPANRMVIHPIANGPTLVPASEVPPTLLPLVGNPMQGILSYTFDVDPETANGRAEGVVSMWGGDNVLRDGGFEDSLGGEYGNRLVGSARTTDIARTGTGAVDLAPPGATPDAVDRLGAIDLAIRPYAPLAQWERFEFWSLREADPVDVFEDTGTLQLLVDLDLDYDGNGDACLVHELMPPASTIWLFHEVTLEDSFSVHDASCDSSEIAVGVIDGPKSLAEIQDNPIWGRARLTGVIVGIRSGQGISTPWPAGNSFFIDDLMLLVGSTSEADFDACYYPAPPATSPISCVSDIGPHDGPIPAGTRRVNVWADSLLPSGFVFEHPYIEPGTFFFHYLERGHAPPAAAVQPPGVGSLAIIEDQNGNQEVDVGESVLARVDSIMPTRDRQMFELLAVLNPGPDGVRREDGSVSLLVRYDNGLPADRPGLTSTVAQESLALQWFENDLPIATLEASQRRPLARKVEFAIHASDRDDTQGAVAHELGGLLDWTLDFGDGSLPLEGASSDAAVIHKYARGSYIATLTTTDSQGATARAGVKLDVLADPNDVGVQTIPDDE